MFWDFADELVGEKSGEKKSKQMTLLVIFISRSLRMIKPIS